MGIGDFKDVKQACPEWEGEGGVAPVHRGCFQSPKKQVSYYKQVPILSEDSNIQSSVRRWQEENLKN